MKTKPIFLISAVILFAGLIIAMMPTRAGAESLTPEEKARAREKLAEIRDTVSKLNFETQRSAAEVFLNASQSDEAAVNLYAKSYKIVNFDMEERDEDEFDDWYDQEKDSFKDPRFLEGLRTQLRYLYLSCSAAESKTLDQVFPNLLTYIEGLSRLTEMPNQALLQDVSGSVFARAFKLEKLLERRDDWEGIPFNIAGIYEKTVFPHLRRNDPDKLMAAWEKRVAQQSQLVDFFEALESRGNRREDRKRSENEVRQMQGGRTGALVKAHDRDDFNRDTLPQLRLGMLMDKYLYVDQRDGAAELLAFAGDNIRHEKAMDWLDQIGALLSGETGSPGSPGSEAPPVYSPPSGLPTVTHSNGTTTRTPAAPTPVGTSTTTSGDGDRPPGLEPVK